MRNYLVLFLGRANAGRTLMAEALVSRWGVLRDLKARSGYRHLNTETSPGHATLSTLRRTPPPPVREAAKT